jgi:hypothetical protein
VQVALALAAAGMAMAVAVATQAEGPFALAWHAVTPRYDRSSDRIAGAAVGLPNPLSTLRVGQQEARQQGEASARRALHRYLDDVLRRHRTPPWVAQRLHAAIEAHAAVTGVRPLADGAAVVEVAVEAATLRQAMPLAYVPWVR